MEKLPEKRKESIIAPIFNKGDKIYYSNYKGISLLSTINKILSQILISRLIPHTHEIHVTGDHQCGFGSNKSIIDNIFCICQTFEKKMAVHETVQQLFVDFKRAYDSGGLV